MSSSRTQRIYGMSTSVDLSSAANSQNNPSQSITNNIILGESKSAEASNAEIPVSTFNPVSYPSVSPENLNTSPYKNLQERSAKINFGTEALERYLFQIYQNILLSENKKLLSNIVSKSKIILTKLDLQDAIKALIGKECSVELEEFEVGCVSKVSNINKIVAIKISESDGSVVDFKQFYNKEYNILSDSYYLSLRTCLVL